MINLIGQLSLSMNMFSETRQSFETEAGLPECKTLLFINTNQNKLRTKGFRTRDDWVKVIPHCLLVGIVECPQGKTKHAFLV